MPKRAASQDGALVRIFNDRGSYHCRAQLSTRARAGLVVGLGIWWRKMGIRTAPT